MWKKQLELVGWFESEQEEKKTCIGKKENEVVFVDDDTKKAKVLDDRHVRFDNETTSLSALAKRLLGCTHPVQGTLYFKYKGQVLDALRKAHEAT